MPRRLAVVPARGGSKRIPDKNIREFCGKPMIAHVLEAARTSRLFDVVHVSTESARIAATTRQLGFDVHFMRPSELADDHTPLMPVLRYVAHRFSSQGEAFDQVWLLMACAALVEPHDLLNAAQVFDRFGGNRSVISVAPYPAPIEWAFDLSGGGELAPVQPGMFAARSQDLKTRYFDTGSFCAFPAQTVLESEGAGDDTSLVAHVLPRLKAIDIDNDEDWRLAEAAFRSLRSS
jgi:pseudaminic acid cytidylyltransferase